MSDTRKVVIEIVQTTSETSSSSSVTASNTGVGTSTPANESDGTINLTALLHPIKSLEKKIIGKNLVVQNAWKNIKSLIGSSVTYSLTKRLYLSEDYMAQNDMNNVFTGISKLSSLGNAIGAGITMGGAVGGAVGALIWGVSEGVSAYHRYDQAFIQLNENNYESSFQKTRLGLNDNGRGTQN